MFLSFISITEGVVFDGEISFTFAGHSGAGTPLVTEAGDVASTPATADDASSSDDSDKENVPPPPPSPRAVSPPPPTPTPSVAVSDHTYAVGAPPSGGTANTLPPTTSSSSVATLVDGSFVVLGGSLSGLLGLSGAAGGGTPRDPIQ